MSSFSTASRGTCHDPTGSVEANADENVWLVQAMTAQLYDVEVPTIN